MLILIARARANALANALALARALDNADVVVGPLALARANALARALTEASALNLDHTLDLDNALVHSRALVSVLLRALADGDLDSDLDSTLARALVHDLVGLDPTAHWAIAVVAGDARSMPSRVARGLVALAVRLLPVSQQSRYRAELHGELVELPCWERLGYSLRVLSGAWELRRALAEAACTPDGAAARRAAER